MLEGADLLTNNPEEGLTMNFFANNAITGLYWDGFAFEAESLDDARVIDEDQLRGLRLAWENVEIEEEAKALDEAIRVDRFHWLNY